MKAIAIGFFDSPPPGIPRWEGGPVPAGCVFWERAMRGQTFYTLASDHYNCAVGSTPPNRAAGGACARAERHDCFHGSKQLPLTMKSSQASIPLGCKGNRTFTGLPDEEMYVTLPGDTSEAVVEKLTEAHEANAAMGKYYSERLSP